MSQSNSAYRWHGARLAETGEGETRAAPPGISWLQRIRSLWREHIRWLGAVWAAQALSAGTITVNGAQASGEIHRPEGWCKSSACLAFAETWIAVPEESDATA